MEGKFVNPEVLPDFFKEVKIIGAAANHMPKYREKHLKIDATLQSESNCDVNLNTSPMLFTTSDVKSIYQNSDFKGIKQLEQQAQEDLQAVYSNISEQGENAWTLVESDGKQFYMSWSETGSIWSFTESNDAVNDTTYQAVVQIGTYSASTGICGIHAYNLTTPTLVTEAVIALIVAMALGSIVADGLGFVVTALALYLANAAAALGFESFSFTISAAALGAIGGALVFFVVFIGLLFLWNWINRQYTIRLQVLNWDSNNSYSVNQYYGSNTKIPGQDDDVVNFTLPKMIPAGSIITPPGFKPVKTLDSVCYYAIVIWQNDNTIFEGLSMSLAMQQNDSTDTGFMWALDCPRFSDNQQAAKDGIESPKDYVNNADWNSNPKNFSISATPSNIPVSVTLDYLSGADDSLYNAIVNINH